MAAEPNPAWLQSIVRLDYRQHRQCGLPRVAAQAESGRAAEVLITTVVPQTLESALQLTGSARQQLWLPAVRVVQAVDGNRQCRGVGQTSRGRGVTQPTARFFRARLLAGCRLAVLTALNLQLDDKVANFLAYALPVALVAWYRLAAGFLFAGIGVLSARVGGVIPHPFAAEPLFVERLFAYLKLSVIALGTQAGVRLGRRTMRKYASTTQHSHPIVGERYREAPNHSHSIINEPSKLLICKVRAAASQIFTVIFTVKVPGTSIGAGLRAIRPKVTFRDLSRSIDSNDDRRFDRRASVSVRETPKKGWHQTP